MKYVAAAVLSLTVIGFAGAASAACNWGAKSDQTAEVVEPVILPQSTPTAGS